MCKKPVALIIMDGFGYNADDYGNAIAAWQRNLILIGICRGPILISEQAVLM